MNWLAENTLTILTIGAVALAMAVFVYFQTRTNGALYGALGVILLRLLQNGFVLIGVPSLWEQVVAGGLLLLVLAGENAGRLRGLVRGR